MAKIEIFPLATGHSCITLRVKNLLEIALLRFLRYLQCFIFCFNPRWPPKVAKIANLISKFNFYKLIPYPMDNCFTGQRDRSRQTPEKKRRPVYTTGRTGHRVCIRQVAYRTSFLSRQRDVIASFSCLVLLRPLVS